MVDEGCSNPRKRKRKQKQKKKKSSEEKRIKRMKHDTTTSTSTSTNTLVTKVLIEDAENGYKNGNFVCSPVMLESMLAMVAAGATGQTLNQLLNFLGAKSIAKLHKSSVTKFVSKILSDPDEIDGVDLCLATGAWIDKSMQPFLPSYQAILKNIYKTKVRSVDFGKKDRVAGRINSWVKKKTKGLIESLVAPTDLNKLTAIIFANAIYFKGSWQSPFNCHMTKEKDFHLVNGEKIRAPFMTNNSKFYYCSFRSFKILQIPYKNNCSDLNEYYMYIFLPEKRNDLQNLLAEFHSDNGLFEKRFPLYLAQFDKLWIPKFNISYKFEATEAMKEMGLTLPFDPMNRELTGMVDSPLGDLLYVEKALQKSCIEVDVKGTKAAAVISLDGVRCPQIKPKPLPTESFVADHPFMFMIREDVSRAVLFMGVVINPKEKSSQDRKI